MNLETGDNLILVQCADEAASATVESLLESAQRLTANVVDDVQVLCAKNDRRVAMNQQLQAMLNPNKVTVKGNPFRVGDKIVCTKNGAYPDAHDKLVTHFVANGELGSVRSIQPGRMVILLQDPIREVIVTYSAASSEKPEGEGDQPRGAVGDWDLGYCLSGHRSQGSQWPYVIVLVDRAGAMVQSRNWVYTVISRAERATLVVGTAATIQQSMRRDGLTGRVTLLVEEIRRISGAREKPDISEIFAGV
jgi:exodeoxyribonuclease V alpha subunit